MVCAGCVKGGGLDGLTKSQLKTHVAGRLKKRLANAKHNPAHNAKNRENGKSRLANAKTNAKHNAKNRAKNSARRAAQQALGGVPTASEEDVSKAFEAVTKKIDACLAESKKKSPTGVALIIYATSAGSHGYSVLEEGVNQFRPRGELADGRPAVPSIRILEQAHPHAIRPADMDAHAGPGIEVADCEVDKILAETLEELSQRHYGPILDESDDDVKIWIRDGAGSLKGIGPYKVCVRTVPLPLPAGWSIRTTEWKGVERALKTDVCQGKTLKKLGATATPVAGSPKAKPRQPDIRQFFSKTG